jgi:hypothetical protein
MPSRGRLSSDEELESLASPEIGLAGGVISQTHSKLVNVQRIWTSVPDLVGSGIAPQNIVNTVFGLPTLLWLQNQNKREAMGCLKL